MYSPPAPHTGILVPRRYWFSTLESGIPLVADAMTAFSNLAPRIRMRFLKHMISGDCVVSRKTMKARTPNRAITMTTAVVIAMTSLVDFLFTIEANAAVHQPLTAASARL